MVTEHPPELTESTLRSLAQFDVVQRGQHLFLSRRVHDLVKEGNVVTGRVEGNRANYRVRLHTAGRFWSCSCSKVAGLCIGRSEHPADNDACKHVIALGYAWLLTPQLFVDASSAKK
ncbi:MAG TPA: hypothetical protein VIL95_01735 [Bacillota bacterium]